MKVTILGAGAWGTTLGHVVAQNGHPVTLWGHDPDQMTEMRQSRRNERHLPGVALPPDWRLTADWHAALEEAECGVVAVPSRVFRQVTEGLGGFQGIVVSGTKGIEYETGLTMSGLLQRNAPKASIAAVSGPTLAYEVIRGMPSAIVAASASSETARTVQGLFHRPEFRVYTNTDLIGVELGGALKNAIAIAAGIGDGMGLGDNSKAALVTRGLAEMQRLGAACGAETGTFSGLSGLGDLTLTCFSAGSRNRRFGERLGSGEALTDLLNQSTTVEGYPTVKSAFRLARENDVAAPIIQEMYAVLYEGKGIAEACEDLLSRDSKSENPGAPR